MYTLLKKIYNNLIACCLDSKNKVNLEENYKKTDIQNYDEVRILINSPKLSPKVSPKVSPINYELKYKNLIKDVVFDFEEINISPKVNEENEDEDYVFLN